MTRINSLEKYFFIVIIGLNLIPILSFSFFPTLDGPAHLYNAQVIKSLLIDHNSSLNDFFSFNKEPVPNWIGHFILTGFNSFLPAFVSEKILLLTYLIGLPISFRMLIQTISPKNTWFSYFIFPFTYSFVFYLGFYNFSIAIVLLFFTYNYWLKHENSTFSFPKILTFFSLIILTYFSHIFVFGILLFLIGLHIALNTLLKTIENPNQRKQIIYHAFKKIRIVILTSIIPLTFFTFYFYSRPSSENNTYINPIDLIKWLKNIRPIIALNFEIEEKYTKKILYLILVLTCFAVYQNGKEFLRNDSKVNARQWIQTLKIQNLWLIATTLILVLYFILPDSDGYAGYVSVRLGLIFFLFYLIWLSTKKFPSWTGVITVVCILYCNFKLNAYYTSSTKEYNVVAKDCQNASRLIPTNSIVLPLNYKEDWFFGHFTNYLGIDKPMVILENYECETGYFPLKWNEKTFPHILFGNTNPSDFECLNWKSNLQSTKTSKIDFVFILGNQKLNNDTCTHTINQLLISQYSKIYQTKHCILYKIKTKK